MAESVIMTTVSIQELEARMLNIFKEAIKQEIAPLRRQFEDRLIDRKDAAKALGVTLCTLHNWHNNGTLKHVKIGGSVKYRESDITAYLSRK